LTHSVVSFGPFHLSDAERQLKKGDEALQLGGRALDTLIALVERAGEAVSQRELISRVWPDVTVERGPPKRRKLYRSVDRICGTTFD
jgi:DNA-binding winged helix-turn-helix (wHTH) protein